MPGTVVRRLPVTEPLPVPEFFVDGISCIEFCGDTVRVELYVNQDTGDAVGENVATLKLRFGTTNYLRLEDDMIAGRCAGRKILNG